LKVNLTKGNKVPGAKKMKVEGLTNGVALKFPSLFHATSLKPLSEMKEKLTNISRYTIESGRSAEVFSEYFAPKFPKPIKPIKKAGVKRPIPSESWALQPPSRLPKRARKAPETYAQEFQKPPEDYQYSCCLPKEGALDLPLEFNKRLARWCQKLILKVWKHHHAWVFYSPVDWKSLNIPTYLEQIKEPMDLGTIMKKLKESKYRFLDNFFYDVGLVFSNAWHFNKVGDDVYEMASMVYHEYLYWKYRMWEDLQSIKIVARKKRPTVDRSPIIIKLSRKPSMQLMHIAVPWGKRPKVHSVNVKCKYMLVKKISECTTKLRRRCYQYFEPTPSLQMKQITHTPHVSNPPIVQKTTFPTFNEPKVKAKLQQTFGVNIIESSKMTRETEPSSSSNSFFESVVHPNSKPPNELEFERSLKPKQRLFKRSPQPIHRPIQNFKPINTKSNTQIRELPPRVAVSSDSDEGSLGSTATPEHRKSILKSNVRSNKISKPRRKRKRTEDWSMKKLSIEQDIKRLNPESKNSYLSTTKKLNSKRPKRLTSKAQTPMPTQTQSVNPTGVSNDTSNDKTYFTNMRPMLHDKLFPRQNNHSNSNQGSAPEPTQKAVLTDRRINLPMSDPRMLELKRNLVIKWMTAEYVNRKPHLEQHLISLYSQDCSVHNPYVAHNFWTADCFKEQRMAYLLRSQKCKEWMENFLRVLNGKYSRYFDEQMEKYGVCLKRNINKTADSISYTERPLYRAPDTHCSEPTIPPSTTHRPSFFSDGHMVYQETIPSLPSAGVAVAPENHRDSFEYFSFDKEKDTKRFTQNNDSCSSSSLDKLLT